MKRYNPQKIEKKWQKYWEQKKIFLAKDKVKGKENLMFLTEFPYPSGNLHIGHWYAFAAPDILARYYRMKGKNVMYPMGFDAFGLPAENAAIKRNINPRKWTEGNIKYMTKQLQSMGASFDWLREISTIDPEYYKWTQWLFLKMFEKGLVYRAETNVNWCPNDKTVLANEQVVNGVCERCGTKIEEKKLAQWMIKITDYAERLLSGLDDLDWPENTKLAQKNWIGKSEGSIVKFKVMGSKFLAGDLEVFTTRPDTIFGCTYVVVSPEHPLIQEYEKAPRPAGEKGITNFEEVKKYVEEARHKTELQRISEGVKNKTGVELKGLKAVNPANGEELPIWVSDYVLASYGTAAVMAVPAHDERDWEFAKKYNLPVKMVICPSYPKPICPVLENAYTEEGYLVGSGEFDGLGSKIAREAIIKWLEGKKLGARKTAYRLRDWVISRQRYWGVPIPLVFCENCAANLKSKILNLKNKEEFDKGEIINPGWFAISEKDLPVKLPKLEDFKPAEDGRSPLAKAEKWVKAKCPNCGELAERETDTMDTFVDSSWYFFRYTDPKNKKKFADENKVKSWLPVSIYIGGAEHNTMHLLYSRFFSKFIKDLGYADFEEPFVVRRNHGMILGPDGQKMSKSRGNVIDPDELVKNYGADVVRMYLAFMGDYFQGGSWDPKGINGVKRFLERVFNLKNKISRPYRQRSVAGAANLKSGNSKLELDNLLHKTIKKVTEDIENFRFNTAVSALMILLNEMEKEDELPIADYSLLITLLAPFAPHITEELWQALGRKKTIHLERWPGYDSKKIEEGSFELVVQVNGKTRDLLDAPLDISEENARLLTLERENVKKWIADATIKKVIFVKNKIINILTE